jgi:hypothetical protein
MRGIIMGWSNLRKNWRNFRSYRGYQSSTADFRAIYTKRTWDEGTERRHTLENSFFVIFLRSIPWVAVGALYAAPIGAGLFLLVQLLKNLHLYPRYCSDAIRMACYIAIAYLVGFKRAVVHLMVQQVKEPPPRIQDIGRTLFDLAFTKEYEQQGHPILADPIRVVKAHSFLRLLFSKTADT